MKKQHNLKSKKPITKAELEREMKRIKAQIDSIEIQEESVGFTKTAPVRIHDLETAVTENRKTIEDLLEKFTELKDDFKKLIK